MTSPDRPRRTRAARRAVWAGAATLLVGACAAGGEQDTAGAPEGVAAGSSAGSGVAPSADPTPSTAAAGSAPRITDGRAAGSVARTDAPPPAPSSSAVDGDPAIGGAVACWSATADGGTEGIALVDRTEAAGLIEPLAGMYGHAAATADVDGDGWLDLFVGSFADRPIEDYQVRGADGPSPDRLLLGGPDGFRIDTRFPGELARSSGATFADLDDDGDLDLVVARNPRGESEIGSRVTTVYEHDQGWRIAAQFAADVRARSVAAVDIDRDGLLDLVVAGDRPDDGPTRLYRNEGGLRFVESTAEWGVPTDIATLAVAVVDLDGDGWVDVVPSGDERVLRGGPDGFQVVEQDVLAWQPVGDEDDPAGIAVGDLDNDGDPDLVIGQHFNSTIDFGTRVPVRILLNRSAPGRIELVDVTDESGSPDLWTKSPHVAIIDLDNDGLQDIVTSAVTADGRPLVLHHTGIEDGRPHFEPVGDQGDGSYFVTGATGDFTRDGRPDVVMVAWEPTSPSRLFVDESASGAWLGIDTSTMGAPVGTRLAALAPGAPGGTVYGWVQSTTGYAAGAPGAVHLGLGDPGGDTTTVRVETPDGAVSSFDLAIDAHHSLGAC